MNKCNINVKKNLYNFTNFSTNSESSTAQQYDIYYEGKNGSIYNKRFGINKVIPMESYVIYNSFKRVHHRLFNIQSRKFSRPLRILDFGCGNGRIFSSIYRIAKKYFNTTMELIAYDISRVGLNDFIEMIENQGFVSSKSYTNEANQNHILGCWIKNNLTIKVIHGNSEKNLNSIKELIDDHIDIVLSIFTVFGHIPGRKNRQDLLKVLGSKLSAEGELIINVSTKSSLLNESITYETLRTQYEVALKYNLKELIEKLSNILNLATETGDLYFIKNDQSNFICAYGHVYNKYELIEDITKADLRIIGNVKVMSIEQPYILSKNCVRKYFDTILSFFLSLNLLFNFSKKFDEKVKNIYAVARSKDQ